MNHRFARIIALTAGLGFTLAGCGSSSSGSGNTPTAQEAPPNWHGYYYELLPEGYPLLCTIMRDGYSGSLEYNWTTYNTWLRSANKTTPQTPKSMGTAVPNSHGYYYEDMPDGKKILCVIMRDGYSGTSTCNWEEYNRPS